MSRTYKVVSGDTLGKIALKYFGVWSKWTSIRDANPQLANRKRVYDGSPFIYPGDVLIIPDDTLRVVSKTPVQLDTASADDISIFVDGSLFTHFTGYRLSFAVDGLDAFSFSAPWQDEKKEYRKAFKPFQFKQCAVYYKKKLLFTGRLLTSAPQVGPEERSITIQGYPLCGVLNDCCIPSTRFPPSYQNMKLEDIATDVTSPFDITVQFDGSTGSVFDKLEYDPGGKILDFLQRLACERGFVFTNDIQGMLYFWKVPVEDVSASFEEGKLPLISCKPSFSAQSMYSHITGFTKTEKDRAAESYTWENTYLINAGVFRPLSFTVQDADGGNIEAAVRAYAGRMFGSCMSWDLKVVGFEDSTGAMYRKGMSVSVLCPGAMIYRETKLQVKQVDIVWSESEGAQTTMKLILPGSLNGELPGVLPWEE